MNAFTFFLGLTMNDGTNLIVDAGYTRQLIGTIIAGCLKAYGVDGFNLTWGEGYWEGSPEPSVNIFVSGIDADNAQAIARDLATVWKQDSVGIRRENVLDFINP